MRTERWIISYNPSMRLELLKQLEALDLSIALDLSFINILVIADLNEQTIGRLTSMKGIEAIEKEGKIKL